MNRTPPALHPGQFVKQRYMDPLGVTASAIARAIGVPRSRMSEILSGQRGISTDTARRLALFFGVEPWVFVERQMAYDLEQLGPVHVEPADVEGFLVGSHGVMPIPRPTREAAPLQATMSPALLARLRAQAAHAPESPPRDSVETTYASGQRAMVSKAQ